MIDLYLQKWREQALRLIKPKHDQIGGCQLYKMKTSAKKGYRVTMFRYTASNELQFENIAAIEKRTQPLQMFFTDYL